MRNVDRKKKRKKNTKNELKWIGPNTKSKKEKYELSITKVIIAKHVTFVVDTVSLTYTEEEKKICTKTERE